MTAAAMTLMVTINGCFYDYGNDNEGGDNDDEVIMMITIIMIIGAPVMKMLIGFQIYTL